MSKATKKATEKRVKKFANLMNTKGKTPQDAARFLKNKAHHAWYTVDSGRGVTEYGISIKTRSYKNSMDIIFNPRNLLIYEAEVIGDRFLEDGHIEYLSNEVTEALREAVPILCKDGYLK